MTLAQIDQRIAQWRQLQSGISLKLVDLDEMPTYLALRSGLYGGTTAVAIAELGGTADAIWSIVARWNEAFDALLAKRAHPPMPWERERWLQDLAARLVDPVIAVPSEDPLDPGDALARPTLSLGQALTRILDDYDRVLALVRRIDEHTRKAERRMGELDRLAEELGASRLRSDLQEIGDESHRDPLGVSLDSFASIERRLREGTAEVDERRRLTEALDRGEARLLDAPVLAARATRRAEECQARVGRAAPVPNPDAGDLREWARTLRSRLPGIELAAARIGLSRWEAAVEERLRGLTEAERSNREQLDRLQEIVGRFSAAQARGAGPRLPASDAGRVADRIRAGLSQVPKDLDALERALVEYERLVRS